MNTQLLEEIPGFTEKCMALMVDCLENFALTQNRLYCEIQQDYEELLQVRFDIQNIVYFSEGVCRQSRKSADWLRRVPSIKRKPSEAIFLHFYAEE